MKEVNSYDIELKRDVGIKAKELVKMYFNLYYDGIVDAETLYKVVKNLRKRFVEICLIREKPYFHHLVKWRKNYDKFKTLLCN